MTTSSTTSSIKSTAHSSKAGRKLLGFFAVRFLEFVGRLPTAVTFRLGTMLLPLYSPFRFRTRERLRQLDPPLNPRAYYRMRLRLALHAVRQNLRRTTSERLEIEGIGHFENALMSGKPVVLLGWHQGPIELLHRLPAERLSLGMSQGFSHQGGAALSATPARPLFVMTASAFSPALSDWMTRGRNATGATVIRPEDVAALRTWVRTSGILAVMVDQVPGTPDDWIHPPDAPWAIPWPRRLMTWLSGLDAEILSVSVRLRPEERIEFRFVPVSTDPGDSVQLKAVLAERMQDAIRKDPLQYNWSYGKIRMRKA